MITLLIFGGVALLLFELPVVIVVVVAVVVVVVVVVVLLPLLLLFLLLTVLLSVVICELDARLVELLIFYFYAYNIKGGEGFVLVVKVYKCGCQSAVVYL